MTAAKAKAIARQCLKRAFINHLIQIIQAGLVPILNGPGHRTTYIPNLKYIDVDDAWRIYMKRGGELCAERFDEVDCRE